jgi:hypothetical protein
VTRHGKKILTAEETILSDIEFIGKDQLGSLCRGVETYGEIWTDFQDDLKSVGCGYWAKVYADLFENGFRVDADELERRLSVPDEIQAKGARAVADFLDEAKDGK